MGPVKSTILEVLENHRISLDLDQQRDLDAFSAVRAAFEARYEGRADEMAALDVLIKAEKARLGLEDEQSALPVAIRAPSHPKAGVRSPRNQVYEHVDKALADGGQLPAARIRQKISEMFETNYGISSIYRALQRGYEQGTYKNKGGKWFKA